MCNSFTPGCSCDYCSALRKKWISGETERNNATDAIKRLRELLGDKADECIVPEWVIRAMEKQKLQWLKRPIEIEKKDEGIGWKMFPTLGLPDHHFAIGFNCGDFSSGSISNPDKDLTIPIEQAIEEVHERMKK